MIWKRYSAVLVACLFFAGASSLDAVENAKTTDPTSSLEHKDSSSTLFKMEKKNKSSRFQVRGTATDRKSTGTETGSFGLEALFGQLFFPLEDQYQGYYFMTGKLESNSRQRFNATFGYFVPQIGGEAKLTYRLLHGKIHDDLPITGKFEKGALEQGLGLFYKKRYTLPLKELTFNSAYTHVAGESVLKGLYNFDTPTAWEQANIITGFGDIDTYNARIEAAFGADALQNPFVKGYRLDLRGGYQNVKYGEFYDVGEITDEGFSGSTSLQVCTPIGILKGGYQDMQSANTAYGGYQLGGVDLYYRNINYEYGGDEKIIGVAVTVDLFDPGAVLDRDCRPFFYDSDSGYTSVYQMEHIGNLASDEFTAQKVNEIIDVLYRVDKTQLPANFRIDDSGDPRLIITTRCPLVNIRSVEPSNATSAFSVSGNEVYIYLAMLPTEQQTVVAKTNVQEDRNCCGYTQVVLKTGVGSVVVHDVNVQEGIRCQPRQNGKVCSADTMCQSEYCAPTGICEGNTDNGRVCSNDTMCLSGYCAPTGICEGNTDNGQVCSNDTMCLSGYCAPTGICEGNVVTGQACTDDIQCAVGNCYIHPRTNTGYCDGGLTTGLSSAQNTGVKWSCNACQYNFQCNSFNCSAGGGPTSRICTSYPQGSYCL